jgi:hypothetical protein
MLSPRRDRRLCHAAKFSIMPMPKPLAAAKIDCAARSDNGCHARRPAVPGRLGA